MLVVLHCDRFSKKGRRKPSSTRTFFFVFPRSKTPIDNGRGEYTSRSFSASSSVQDRISRIHSAAFCRKKFLKTISGWVMTWCYWLGSTTREHGISIEKDVTMGFNVTLPRKLELKNGTGLHFTANDLPARGHEDLALMCQKASERTS